MLLKQIVPVTFSLTVALIAIVLFNEKNLEVKSEFSSNLLKWFTRGEYFNYRNNKIFYVYEKMEEDSLVKPVVVFLHGFPTSSYDFMKIWNQFLATSDDQLANMKTKANSLLAFDYLGYGFSDKPQYYNYSIFDMADMVERLVLHLKIESVVLVAHDVGDSVAQEILRRDNLKNNHYKVEKCILMNGGIMTDIYKPVLAQYIMRNEYFGQILFSNFFFRYFIFKNRFSQLFGEFKQPSEMEMYDMYLGIKYKDGNERLYQTIEYMKEREEYGSIWYDALNETAMPVHFIYGPADPINPRDKFPSKLREELPRVKLAVLSEMIGHYPHFEDSYTVFNLIKNIL